MSHLTIPSKETILQHFHHFLAKAVQEDPASSDILQDFYRLHNMLLDNIPTASCISEFLTSLPQKYSQLGAPKELQTPDTSGQNIPPNIPLKYFDPSIAKNSSSLSRFTFYSYKDYLRKNSVRLPSSSRPVYTQLVDFLPDSQNFYRVIGLGLIGLYLTNPGLTNRLRNICNKVVSEELNLSAQDYPFTSEELKITFYSYINQLIDVSNNSSDANQAQEILFSMGAVDKAFDAAVISFVKNEIIHYLDRKIEDKDLKNRLWLAESDVVDDIISQIPDIFNIRLVVQTVENRSIKEIVYQPQYGGDFPEVHILNEKHVSYQNFALLRKETEKAQRLINTEDSSPLIQNKDIYIKDGYESKKKFIRRERSRDQDGDEHFWGVESDSYFSHNDSDVSPSFDSSTRPEYKVKKRTDPTEESILEREEVLQERIPTIKKIISDRITPEGSKERNFQSVKEDFSTADTKGKSSDRDFRVDVKEWAVTSNNGTRPGIKMFDEKQSAKTAIPEQYVTRTLSQENTYSNQNFGIGVNKEIGNAYRMYSAIEPKQYATPIDGRELKERTNMQSAKDYMSSNQEKEQENKRRISKEEIEELRRKYGSKRS